MKKATIIAVLLIFSTMLLAQSKLKKEISTTSGCKSISLFDKKNGKLLCAETWDSTRLQTKNKSIFYQKINCQYDAQNRIVSDEFSQIVFDANGKKMSSNRRLYKYKYGNPMICTVLNWDSAQKLKDSVQTLSILGSDNLMLETTVTTYSATRPAPYISSHSKFEYNNAHCLTSEKHVSFDSLQHVISVSENYITPTSNCLTDTYVHVRGEGSLPKDTVRISRYTYKDNQKDIFVRSSYGHLGCDFGLFDSTHTIKNDDGRLLSEKSWRDNTHISKEYTYLKNGKIGMVYTDFLGPISYFKLQTFYHYDNYDSLVLIKDYAIMNGKIDSTDADIIQEIIYERDSEGRPTKITNHNYNTGSSITDVKYDCDGRIKQKSVNNFNKATLTQFEYFGYPCTAAPLSENTMTIYPNPAQDVLNIEIYEDQHIKKVEIFNLQGPLIKTYIIEDCNLYNRLDISDLSNGMYLVKVLFDNQKQVSNRFEKY